MSEQLPAAQPKTAGTAPFAEHRPEGWTIEQWEAANDAVTHAALLLFLNSDPTRRHVYLGRVGHLTVDQIDDAMRAAEVLHDVVDQDAVDAAALIARGAAAGSRGGR